MLPKHCPLSRSKISIFRRIRHVGCLAATFVQDFSQPKALLESCKFRLENADLDSAIQQCTVVIVLLQSLYCMPPFKRPMNLQLGNRMRLSALLAVCVGAADRLTQELELSSDYANAVTWHIGNRTTCANYFKNSSNTNDMKKAVWLSYNDTMVTLYEFQKEFIANRTKYIAEFEDDLQLREQALNQLFYSNVTDITTRANYTQIILGTEQRIMATLMRYNTSRVINNVTSFPNDENMIYLGKEWVNDANKNLGLMMTWQTRADNFDSWWKLWANLLLIQ